MKKCFECLFYKICKSVEFCTGICGEFKDKNQYQIAKTNCEKSKGCEHCIGHVEERSNLIENEKNAVFIDMDNRLTIQDCWGNLEKAVIFACPYCGRIFERGEKHGR